MPIKRRLDPEGIVEVREPINGSCVGRVVGWILYFQFIWVLVCVPKRQQVDVLVVHYFVVQDGPFIDDAFTDLVFRPVQWI